MITIKKQNILQNSLFNFFLIGYCLQTINLNKYKNFCTYILMHILLQFQLQKYTVFCRTAQQYYEHLSKIGFSLLQLDAIIAELPYNPLAQSKNTGNRFSKPNKTYSISGAQSSVIDAQIFSLQPTHPWVKKCHS